MLDSDFSTRQRLCFCWVWDWRIRMRGRLHKTEMPANTATFPGPILNATRATLCLFPFDSCFHSWCIWLYLFGWKFLNKKQCLFVYLALVWLWAQSGDVYFGTYTRAYAVRTRIWCAETSVLYAICIRSMSFHFHLFGLTQQRGPHTKKKPKFIEECCDVRAYNVCIPA